MAVVAEKRNHHYVPQFYLRGFVAPQIPPGHTPFVWVRDVRTGALYKRAPKNIAAEIGFYAISTDGEIDYQTVENELEAIESRAAFALRRYLTSPEGAL